MELVEASTNRIILKGHLRQGTVQLKNIHPSLAVVYEVSAHDGTSIFPSKGVLFNKEAVTIQVKSVELAPVKSSLLICASLNTSYNKHYLKRNSMSGWSQVKKIEQRLRVAMIIESPQLFHSEFKEKNHFQNKDINISAIMSQPENNQLLVGPSAEELDLHQLTKMMHKPKMERELLGQERYNAGQGKRRHNPNHNLQVIMLAAFSAFFVGMGANFSRFFS